MDIFGNFSRLKGDKSKRHIQKKVELDYSYSETVLDSVGKVEDKTSASKSSGSMKAMLLLFFCILCSRLFFLQVVQGESNQKLAEGNRIRPRIIEATRGIITDKDGVWLARNKPNFALAVYPSDLPKSKPERNAVYSKLAEMSGETVEQISSASEENGLLSLDIVTIKDNLSHDDALLMEKKIADLPGVVVAKKASREYTVLPGLGHVLGYTGKISPLEIQSYPDYFLSDRVGKTGIESEYEKYLRGKHGVEQIEVNSKGSIVRVLVQDGNREPVPGYDTSLYLDRGLQQKTSEALSKGIEEAKKATGDDKIDSGVAIVMDVNSGGILSMVSLPDYDNNLFSTQISSADYQKLMNDESYPMFDRATKGTYPPGSIVKIVMAAAGLTEGNITTNTTFDTPPEIKIGDYTFPDWKDHGATDIKRAIAESNNIFFYSVGGGFDKIKGIGINNIKKYWKLFGLGEKTGIDLPSEAEGLLPDPEWKKKVKNEDWYIGDTYHVSIGQGDLLVTPIQMMRATATIANGGKLLQPQLVHKITDQKGNVIKEFGPRVERQNFISSDIIKTVQQGMRLTITDGSARNLNDLPVSVAGKTGTAQFLDNQKTHAWFECYAPYENPQIAVVVLIDGGGGGHEIAAPVAKDILNYYFTR
ncbi:MAG: penicillin-binding protein 2 [Patescibacteria group bacterium]|nr:penicillin-binding protein 2 [Patescibacteria group bacterium]